MDNRTLAFVASVGLALGGILGLAGVFAPTVALRGLAWGIDGVALVMACALLTIAYFRKGDDLVAAGFLVFAIGQVAVLSCAAMELARSVPFFGAGVGLWAVALAMISASSAFPLVVRLLGFVSLILFGATAVRIFTGSVIGPMGSPLPFYAYPALVATMVGWIWTLLSPPAKA
jgi:hypothetical protein